MSLSVPDTNAIGPTTGGVAAPRGFRAAGVSAGIKATGAPDLALLVSDRPAAAAGVFTTNLAQAPPVIVARGHLAAAGGFARAVVVNSGCANACTGDEGLAVARGMAAETARLVDCPADQVLVASTGVIGVALSLDRIRAALPAAMAALSESGGSAAARAIMTTDPFPKEAAVRLTLAGREVVVGGMAKGAGMIEPMMATMLGFLATDAAVPPPLLDRVLRETVHDTFNAITVDGECSTNDCVLMLANGASGALVDETTVAPFTAAVRAVCLQLALAIVRGGEGATKLVTVSVSGAASPAEARQAARAIANSLLVKTAVHGGDPNWGRLVAVAGRAGVTFDLLRTSVRIGPVLLFERGRPHDEASPEAAQYLRGHEITIAVDLGVGHGESTVWTCDLSAEYVRINAEYRT